MPGPTNFPTGGIHEQKPANAVDIDVDELDEDEEQAAKAEAAERASEHAASYFPPGEPIS